MKKDDDFKDINPGPTERDSRGRFISAPANPPFNDKAIAKKANKRRRELAQDRAVEGLERAVKEKGLSVASGEEAWGHIVSARAISALKPGARQGTADARFIGESTGYLRNEPESVLIGDGLQLTLTGKLEKFIRQFGKQFEDDEFVGALINPDDVQEVIDVTPEPDPPAQLKAAYEDAHSEPEEYRSALPPLNEDLNNLMRENITRPGKIRKRKNPSRSFGRG